MMGPVQSGPAPKKTDCACPAHYCGKGVGVGQLELRLLDVVKLLGAEAPMVKVRKPRKLGKNRSFM